VGGTMSSNGTDLPAKHPHNAGDGCTMRVGRTALRSDSQAVSEDWRGGDSPLTRAPARCQSIQCPGRGAGMVSRVEGALERGGASHEGLGPSSEAGTHPRGAPSPRARRGFRGAAAAPRARWRFARGAPGSVVCWVAKAFWAMSLSLPWAVAMRGVICTSSIVHYYYFLKRGDFPGY
jgi:hypothetical protein